MEFIPICEEKIRSYIGLPICAVLQDGTYCAGTLANVRNGYLIFKPETVSTQSQRIKAQLSDFHKKANTSMFGFPGIGLGAGRLGLGLGLMGGGFGLGIGLLSVLFAGRVAGFPFFF